VVADGQHLAPLDALSGISISTTETIPASCVNATDFFNTLLEAWRAARTCAWDYEGGAAWKQAKMNLLSAQLQGGAAFFQVRFLDV